MTEIYRFIFERLTDPLSLPIAWYWEYLIIGIIGTVAYLLAYRKVGFMYRSGEISGRGAGSILHWIIRFGYFIVIWAIVYALIAFYRFFKVNWMLILPMTGVFALIVYAVDSLRKELNSNA